MSRYELLFLGTGGSLGVPVVGCKCEVCQSTSVHNKRLRPSALLRINQRTYLIDCGPDYRFQALSNHIDHLDGVIFTHAHHDHSAGIDELRVHSFKNKTPMLCVMSPETYTDLSTRFYYIFGAERAMFTANLAPIIMEGDQGAVQMHDIVVRYNSYFQAGMKVNGLRLGNMAYISDIKDYNESVFEFLEGVEVLVLSALRYLPSPMHLSIDQAVAFAQRVGAKQTWFTHISHELDHEKANAYLPDNIRLSYDGLVIPFIPEIL